MAELLLCISVETVTLSVLEQMKSSVCGSSLAQLLQQMAQSLLAGDDCGKAGCSVGLFAGET